MSPVFAGTRRLKSLTISGAGALGVVALAAFGAGSAQAEPEVEPTTPDHSVTVEPPTASAPVEVTGSEYSYIATHALTRQADDMALPEKIRALPLPPEYKPSNDAFALQFDHALAGARNSPGGCVQVVVDPQTGDGNLFNYGFFPIAGDYCS